MKPESHSQGLEPHANSLQLKAILVVDDDQQLASALQWILADENFLVDVAFDGDEALLKNRKACAIGRNRSQLM